MRNRIPSGANTKTVADGALIMRKSIDLLEDTLKQLTEVQEILSNYGCVLWLNKGDGEPLRGAYADAHPRVAQSCKIPSRTSDPAGYAKLCLIFGAPDHELTRLHYPALKAYITKILERGEPLPDELKEYKPYTENKLTAVERSGNTLESDAMRVQGLFDL